MKKIKIAFLILHFNTVDDTRKCVESIKKSIKSNYKIVIVDNCSPNESGTVLKKIYEKDQKVHVLLASKNLGFARGNNLGFKYIKKYFKTEYIAMINNDTYLLDNKFMSIVDDEYERSGFAVLGPKIILPHNKVNPVQEKLLPIEEMRSWRARLKINYWLNFFYMNGIYESAKKIYYTITNKNPSHIYSTCNKDKYMQDIVLHGCFLIFSEKYIDKFDGIDPRTFMYMEEKILYTRLKQNNLLSVYNPKLVIFHNEDSATNSLMKNERNKKLFLFKNAYFSSGILIEEMEKIGREN